MKRNTIIFGFIIIIFITPIFCANIFIIKPNNRYENNIENYQPENLKEDLVKEQRDGTFIYSINGKRYLAEYITEKKLEDMKKALDFRDPDENYNIIIDGHGTGYAPPSEENLEELLGQIIIKDIIEDPITSNGYRASKDISSEIYFPPVGDQGSQGSCASWANVYYAYGYLEAKDYGWDASSGNADYLLSPAWSYNKLAAFDYGSMPIETGELVKEWGVATLSSMPYDDSDVDSWGNETAWREAPDHRALDFTIITYVGPNTIDTIKGLLDSGIPVTIGIDAYQFYNGLNESPADYILNSTEYDSTSLNHAQCFVGYDDSITDGSDVGAFRVVNSWGDTWMDYGFYWLTYEAFMEFGGIFNQFIGFYTDIEDYEPTLIATWEFSKSPIRMNDIFTLGVGLEDSLDTITPNYDSDDQNFFPSFMALDISAFQSYYVADNNVLFSLYIESSSIDGTISSFKVERYQSGIFQEITPESLDVPKYTPGYAHCSFMIPDHELKVLLEFPTYPEKDISYIVNATVVNEGSSSENNVKLKLYIDGLLVDSATGLNLLPGENHTINYIWTPDKYRYYNITAYAPPVLLEFYELNNHIVQLIRISSLGNYTMTLDYSFNWIDASSGTELFLDDDDYATVKLPFDFIFYDYKFSMINIGSNGYLSFSNPEPEDFYNQPFPLSGAEYSYMISPFWDDLNPEEGVRFLSSLLEPTGLWNGIIYLITAMKQLVLLK